MSPSCSSQSFIHYISTLAQCPRVATEKQKLLTLEIENRHTSLVNIYLSLCLSNRMFW
jgi:hypothetical protein